MASERPPREYLPIFNPLQYEGAGLRALAGGSDISPNKLDFPEAQNTNRVKTDTDLTSHVRQLIGGLNYDGDAIVGRYSENGRTPSLTNV